MEVTAEEIGKLSAKLQRLEKLLLMYVIQDKGAAKKKLASLGFSTREIEAAKKAPFDFDIEEFVSGSDADAWK